MELFIQLNWTRVIDNVLEFLGIKPLPEPMLTKIVVAIWRHHVTEYYCRIIANAFQWRVLTHNKNMTSVINVEVLNMGIP